LKYVTITRPPESIEAHRLILVWMSPDFMRASLAGRQEEASRLIAARLPEGWPDERGDVRLRMRLEQMEREPDSAPWLLRAIVRRSDMTMIGYITFHDPPADGRAELGYTVFEEHRRRGYASEAALAMMRWAREVHDVRAFVVSISPDNQASLALAAKLGFLRTGTRMDEVDGEEWVFEREAGSRKKEIGSTAEGKQEAESNEEREAGSRVRDLQ
jgi:ribosomal-protein-alanine N-acetyltransferase